jgi:hypothetical protein
MRFFPIRLADEPKKDQTIRVNYTYVVKNHSKASKASFFLTFYISFASALLFNIPASGMSGKEKEGRVSAVAVGRG